MVAYAGGCRASNQQRSDTMQLNISDLSDQQLVAIAAELGWKATDPKRIRNTVSLNIKSAKVRNVIQAELEKAAQIESVLDALAGVNMPNPLSSDYGEPSYTVIRDFDESGRAKDVAHFGMDEKTAAEYIQAKFGLVKRMAKRAVMRGIIRDEYHGKGYCVKVTDLNPDDTENENFNIAVFAE
jgi:hypothetical protein